MSSVTELVDELAREIDADPEDLRVAVDRVRTRSNPRRRAYEAITSPMQTTLQGRNRAPELDGRPHLHVVAALEDDALRADGGREVP